MKRLTNLSLIAALILSTSACSMRDRTAAHSVSVQLPQVWANASTLNILNQSNNMSISYSTPSGLGSFQCYGLNVTGPGIQSDVRMGCTDPASGMGMLAGFVPVSSGRIEMMVPAGGNRKVELIGIQSDVGCPILDALLASGGKEALKDLGDPYILGSTVTDIFDDTAVTIVASFNSNSRAFEGCGGNGGEEQALRLQVYNDSPVIQKDHCSSLGVFAQGQGPYPSVIPTILSQPTTGSVAIYSDAICTSPVVGYSNFTSGNYLQYFVKTSAVVTGTFTAQVGTTATGWQNPSVTYTPVNDRLGMTAATPSINTNTCTSISLTNYADNTNTGSGTLGSLRLSAHSNNDSNTPPAVQVYSNGSNCSTQTSPIASTMVESSKVFNIGTFGTTSGIVYVRSNTGEQIHFSLSRTTNDAEPAGTSITFIPYSLGTIPGPNLTGATYGGGTLNIPFNSGTETVPTKIQIGSSDCVITSRTSAAIQCTIPYSPPGFFPLNIFVGSMQFYSGYSYEYRTTVSTFAGTAGVSGSLDATGLSSKFFGASGAALNPMNGDLYVADTGNHIIRKITSAGVVTTLAGLANVSGSTDSTGSAARFNNPMGLALHGSYLYVADKMNHKIRRIDVNTAVVTTLAGNGTPGSTDASGTSASFNGPMGITVNPSNGDLYISDTVNHKIRKFNASNSMVSTVSGNGSPGNSNGTLVASTYNSPMGIAFDPTTQNLYVAEANGHRIRKLELLNSIVSVFAGSPSTPVPGWTDGSSILAQFNGPRGVAVDSLGNVFVADSGNNLIRRIDPSGFVYTVAGNASAGYADGLGHVSTFTLPSALVSNTPTSLTIIDTSSFLVRKINW